MSIICKKCGLVDDYHTIKKSNQETCWCNGCGAYIKNLPQGKPPKLYFGKYYDREIASMTSPDEIKYLAWVLGQTICKNPLQDQILAHLNKFSK